MELNHQVWSTIHWEMYVSRGNSFNDTNSCKITKTTTM